jgi:hypothetical protein
MNRKVVLLWCCLLASHTTGSFGCLPENVKSWACTNGQCINPEYVCDQDQRTDCDDGSDEEDEHGGTASVGFCASFTNSTSSTPVRSNVTMTTTTIITTVTATTKTVGDNDVCPQESGWFTYDTSDYFRVHGPSASWDDARKTCQALGVGSDLLALTSIATACTLYRDTTDEEGMLRAHLSLDLGRDADVKSLGWIQEHCVELDSAGRHDTACDKQLQYVCEKPTCHEVAALEFQLPLDVDFNALTGDDTVHIREVLINGLVDTKYSEVPRASESLLEIKHEDVLWVKLEQSSGSGEPTITGTLHGRAITGEVAAVAYKHATVDNLYIFAAFSDTFIKMTGVTLGDAIACSSPASPTDRYVQVGTSNSYEQLNAELVNQMWDGTYSVETKNSGIGGYEVKNVAVVHVPVDDNAGGRSRRNARSIKATVTFHPSPWDPINAENGLPNVGGLDLKSLAAELMILHGTRYSGGFNTCTCALVDGIRSNACWV